MNEVTIPGPEGRLEARYNQGEGNSPPLAILLHPHPKFGGNMNNKVIYSCFKTLSNLGFSVLRFNYRGVGNSEGTYSGDDGIGEMTDAACALDWLLFNNTSSQYYNIDFYLSLENKNDANLWSPDGINWQPFTFALGTAQNPTSANGIKCDIAEMILFNQELTEIQKTNVYDYLNKKWNVVGNPNSSALDSLDTAEYKDKMTFWLDANDIYASNLNFQLYQIIIV